MEIAAAVTRFLHTAVLATSLVLVSIAPVACSRDSGDGPPSILQAKGDSVHVRLLDAVSGRRIANADVELGSDKGIRCVQAPCPTNGQEWAGRSDAAAQVVVPTSAVQAVTAIKTAGYVGDLIGDSEPAGDGGWIVELLPQDSSESAPRPIKLIDRGSGRAIANTPVRVEFQTDAGKWDSVKTATNALGYIFVPFNVVVAAAEHTWVVVPGYGRTHLDFAWARRRTKLDRL
jgi:hypothetical protein